MCISSTDKEERIGDRQGYNWVLLQPRRWGGIRLRGEIVETYRENIGTFEREALRGKKSSCEGREEWRHILRGVGGDV